MNPQQALDLWGQVYVGADVPARKPKLPKQPPLPLRFDHAEGQHLAQMGTDQALYATAALPWVERAERWLMARVAPFTADHLIEDIGLPDGKPGQNKNNCVGALIRSWAGRGRIERAGFVSARRVESHGRLVSMWRRSSTPEG